MYSTYVGSSNLTINALNSNREWNLKVATTDTSGLAEQLSEEIESQISESKPLTDAWLKLYEEDFKKYAPQRPNRKPIEKTSQSQTIQPNAMQVEALMNLAQLRKQAKAVRSSFPLPAPAKRICQRSTCGRSNRIACCTSRNRSRSSRKLKNRSKKCLDARKANSACFRVAQGIGSQIRVRHRADDVASGNACTIRRRRVRLHSRRRSASCGRRIV